MRLQSDNSLLVWKETALTAAVILVCLLLSVFYPITGIGQQITSSLVFLLFLPLIFIKLILKKSPSDFGLSLQNVREGLGWGGLLLLASLGLAILLFYFSPLKNSYTLPGYVTTNFSLFLVYELIFMNFFFFLQEFFFKGLVLFSFTKKFGFWAIAFSSLFYVLLLTTTNGFGWQSLPFIILSITGGIVAYKSRSFLYSYFMGLLFLIFFDAYLIYILN